MKIYKLTRWFSRSWWQYLFEKPVTWKKFWCRSGCHKCGPIYYNMGGFEPDYRCKNCGDEL